ncbi:MAG: DNA mismatch repair endonuclease MutL [Planctomycetes bacterium]|nr:DNA mismatch repair endonuclease MutL [Planctomycetota bacterium]
MIRSLAPEVVNQIAAGEVVERPASVVKELVENAIDAGGRRIRVEVDAGGCERIRVIDDGDGFLPEDLPLAFASHATSKLSVLQDLDHIATLGFRGEALASIGSVARASIRSRRHDRDAGAEIHCDGGRIGEPQPCGCPTGSQLEIRDLFYNTPARRRFLKSPGTEKARIQELLAELALARLDLDLTLVADGREVLRLPAGQSLTERFASCFGRELARGLLPVERAFGELRVEGVIGEPDLARRDSKLELLYVNGRQARENSAVHAIRQAYREFLMGGRFPIYALTVALPPDQVDVNVHPRKAEVRFLESRKVAGCLHETVRAALQGRAAAASAGGVALAPELPRARSGFPDLPRDLFGRADGGAVPEPTAATSAPPVVVRDGADRPPFGHKSATQDPAANPDQNAGPAPAARPNPFARANGRFLQVHDLYLLLEGPDGLLIVDQHALHERVVYERLRAEHRARAVTVQQLLVPTVVELHPGEKAWLLEVAEDLAAEGLQVGEFSPSAMAIYGVPAVLAKTAPERLLRALLADDGADARPRLREQISERFHSMACRAAVMGGDRLTDEEIAALLQAASTLEHPHNCPHGRPTVLTFTHGELERYFRRRC